MNRAYLLGLRSELEHEPFRRGIHGDTPIWSLHSHKHPAVRGKGKAIMVRRYIYEVSAARELDIDYKPWYDCSEGDFGLSDDGIVQLCRRSRRFEKPISINISLDFVVGRTWFTKYHDGGITYRDFFARDHIEKKCFGRYGAKTSIEQWIRSKRVKNGLYMLAQLYIKRCGFLTDEDGLAICRILFPKRVDKIKEPREYIWWYMRKHDIIQNLFKKMLRKAFEEGGMTAVKAVSMLSQAFEMAQHKENAGEMRRVAEVVLDVWKETSQGHTDNLATGHELAGLYEGMTTGKLTIYSRENEVIPLISEKSSG